MKLQRLIALAGVTVTSIVQAFTVTVKENDNLTSVRNQIRAAKAAGKIAAGEAITVTLSPGSYRLSDTLTFEQADSGTEKAPVTWRAEKPGTVEVTGGITIDAAAFSPVTDARRASFASNVQARVRVADISKLLPGELKPWADAYHGMHPGPWLYQAGEPLEIASWPNGKWAIFNKVLDSGLPEDDLKSENAIRPGAFYLQGAENSARWNMDEGVWCDGYWTHDWCEEVLRLASYDLAQEVARPRKIHHWGLLGRHICGMKGRRFKVLNVAAELDTPGEWWIDRKAKKLYFLPIPGRENLPVTLVPARPTLVAIKNAEWIRFENITVAYSHGTAPGAIVGSQGKHIVFKGCRFANFGGVGLAIYGRDNYVTECLAEKVGAMGVQLGGGDRKHIIPACNLLEKSEIRAYGRFSRTSMGVRVDGCGNAVRNCEIHHGAAGAIGYGGNEHLFANNNIHHVMLEACDAGATYSGYDSSSQGNLLFGNYVHDLGDGDPKLAVYRSAFYFDDCEWGDDVIGNHFVGGGLAIHLGGGNMHRIHNNLFQNLLRGISCDDRGITWEYRLRGSFLPDAAGHSWAEIHVLPFAYRQAPWHVAYPEIADLIDDRPNLPHSNPITGNIFQNCKTPITMGSHIKPLADELPITGNTIFAGTNNAFLSQAPQPISFADAVCTTLKSPDGQTQVRFFLNAIGRFSWSAEHAGKRLIDSASLGVTVGYRDLGKLIIPGAAKCRTVQEAPTGELYDDSNIKFPQKAKGYAEARIPMQDLITGRTVATFIARAFNNGIAFRWQVPGSGVRKIAGEMTTWDITGGKLFYRHRSNNGGKSRWYHVDNGPWNPKDGVKITVYDANREQMPRFRLHERGRVTGLVFPDNPSGWKTTGEITTPWRVTHFGD